MTLGGRRSYVLLLLVAALPRLVVLGYERGKILTAFVDKSDQFARTFVAHGTYGFIPGVPSAYTQPLYGFFLVPLYWLLGRHWLVVGLAHVAVAVATAWVVYAVGRRFVSDRLALAGAVLATIHPYLVWHDVHMNREILDDLLAPALVLATFWLAERLTWRRAALLGVLYGAAVLGNVRLLGVPLVLLAYVAWRAGLGRPFALAVAAFLAAAAVVTLPWVVRNKAIVGCYAITTDSRALWKANNPRTYSVMTHGGWLDAVPIPKSWAPSPQDAWRLIYLKTGRVVRVDECAQESFYENRVFAFWVDHPVEKLKLAALGDDLLWNPRVTETDNRPGAGTWLDAIRSWAEPAFMVMLYVFAAVGLFVVRRSLVVLALGLFAYQTFTAAIFMGATRYRISWDFLVGLLAVGGAGWLARQWALRHARVSVEQPA